MRKLIISLLGIFAFTILAGCATDNQQNQNPTETNTPKVVKIGLITPLSGPASTVGEDHVAITQLAVERFNATHTNVQVQLIVEDGKGEGKDATSAVNKLLDVDKVDVIYGGDTSSEALASAQITQKAKIINLVAGASAPALSDIGDYVFRQYSDLDDAKFLAQYLQEQKVEKIGIIYENSDYGVGYINAFQDTYTGEIVFQVKYNSNEKDYNMLMQSIKNKIMEVDKIFFLANSDTNFINIMHSLEKNVEIATLKNRMIATSIMVTNAVFETMPELIEGIEFVMLPSSEELGSKAQQYLEELQKTYTLKTNELYGIFFGERIEVILRAIDAGNYTSSEIYQYLRSFSESNPIMGIWGEYYFSGSDTIGLQFIMKKIQNGSVVALQ